MTERVRDPVDHHVAPSLKPFAAMIRAMPFPMTLAELRAPAWVLACTAGMADEDTPRQKSLFNEKAVTVNRHVSGVYIVRKEAPAIKRAMYYLHAGGLFAGTAETQMAHTYSMATALKVTSSLSVEYRLCPEAKLQELIDDLVAGYLWLLAQGFTADNIVVYGSSGGGIGVMYLLAELNRIKFPQPRVALASNPHGVGIQHTEALLPFEHWPSTIADLDPMFSFEFVKRLVLEVTESAEVKLTASQLLSVAGFRGITSKLLITVGATEIILTADQQLAFLAAKAGVDVSLKIWAGGVHSQEMAPVLNTSDTSAANFINQWALKHFE